MVPASVRAMHLELRPRRCKKVGGGSCTFFSLPQAASRTEAASKSASKDIVSMSSHSSL